MPDTNWHEPEEKSKEPKEELKDDLRRALRNFTGYGSTFLVFRACLVSFGWLSPSRLIPISLHKGPEEPKELKKSRITRQQHEKHTGNKEDT